MWYSPGRRSHIWVINHPDDVKRVLVSNHKNYTKGMGLDRVKILLGNGIMTSEGELWQRQRRRGLLELALSTCGLSKHR